MCRKKEKEKETMEGERKRHTGEEKNRHTHRKRGRKTTDLVVSLCSLLPQQRVAACVRVGEDQVIVQGLALWVGHGEHLGVGERLAVGAA